MLWDRIMIVNGFTIRQTNEYKRKALSPYEKKECEHYK